MPDVHKSLLQIKEEFNRDIDALSKSIDEKWLTIEGDEDYNNSKEELKDYVNNARDYGNSSIDVMNSIEGAKVSGLYYDKNAVSNEDRDLMDKAYKEAKEGFEEADKFQKGLTQAMEMPQKNPLIKYAAAEAIAALGTRSFDVYKSNKATRNFYDKLHHCATLQTKLLDLSIKYERGNILTKPLYKAQFKVLSAALDSHLKIAETYREKAIECGEKAIKRLGAIDNFLEKHGMLSENLLDKKIDMAITQNIILDYKKEMDNTRDNNVDIVEFAHRVANNEVTHISSPGTARAKFEKEVVIPMAKKIKEESSKTEVENEMDDLELE